MASGTAAVGISTSGSRASLEPRLAAVVPGTSADAMAEFYTSALLGMLAWWVGQDFPCAPDQIASIYGRLAIPGIQAATTGVGITLTDQQTAGFRSCRGNLTLHPDPAR